MWYHSWGQVNGVKGGLNGFSTSRPTLFFSLFHEIVIIKYPYFHEMLINFPPMSYIIGPDRMI